MSELVSSWPILWYSMYKLETKLIHTCAIRNVVALTSKNLIENSTNNDQFTTIAKLTWNSIATELRRPTVDTVHWEQIWQKAHFTLKEWLLTKLYPTSWIIYDYKINSSQFSNVQGWMLAFKRTCPVGQVQQLSKFTCIDNFYLSWNGRIRVRKLRCHW